MLYIDPRGVREGIALIFFGKSVFEKHPNVHLCVCLITFSQKTFVFLYFDNIKEQSNLREGRGWRGPATLDIFLKYCRIYFHDSENHISLYFCQRRLKQSNLRGGAGFARRCPSLVFFLDIFICISMIFLAIFLCSRKLYFCQRRL